MIKKITAWCISLVLAFSLVGSVQAATIPLLPTDDAWTFNNDPDNPHDDTTLLVGYSNTGGCIQNYRGFMRFDISSYTSDVNPANTVVRVYAAITPTWNNESVSIFSAGDDWNGTDAGNGDETTLTWNNQPDQSVSLLDTKPLTGIGAVLFSSTALGNYVNSQRSANGGNDIVTFMITWSTCTTQMSNIVAFEDRENYFGTDELPLLWPGYPTAVTISSFSAAPKNRDIGVQWQTASEIDLLGFNLYRSTEVNGIKVKLNQSIIPAQGMENPPNPSYSFLDTSATPGQTYYYWLEMVVITGTEMLDSYAQATANYVNYLPQVRK